MKTFLNNYSIPLIVLVALVFSAFKWGAWTTVGIGAGFFAVFIGMLAFDLSAKANAYYWSFVASVAATGYYLKTEVGNAAAILFTGVGAFILLVLMFFVADYLMKGKYKR